MNIVVLKPHIASMYLTHNLKDNCKLMLITVRTSRIQITMLLGHLLIIIPISAIQIIQLIRALEWAEEEEPVVVALEVEGNDYS